MEESRVYEIIKQNNQQLLSQMSEMITTTFGNLKRPAPDETSSGQILREIKKIRTTDTRPMFKKKSNEDQYKAASKMLESLEEAKDCLASNEVHKAQEAIEEGIKFAKERQKLILLADQSKFGWNTVKEYKQHDLAEDSEDEKKIYKAEARAARNSRRNSNTRAVFSRKSSLASSTVSSQQSPIPVVTSRGFSDLRSFPPSQRPSPGTCFSCGKSGHWRSSCPLNSSSNSTVGKQ